jgi:hypothetical protein
MQGAVADAPKPGQTESQSGARRVTTQERKAITAERAVALAPEPPRKVTKEMIQATAVETMLNSAGVLRDLVGDFQRKDAFFKYKILVVFLWLGLSTTSAVVGCPGAGPTNEISARLVIAVDASRPVYMVKNDSTEPWTNVEITVNGKWRTTASEIAAHGDLTLSPRLLINPEGESAPETLKVSDIEVRSAEGEASLMKGGQKL